MASRFGATGIPSNGAISGAAGSARTQRNGTIALSARAQFLPYLRYFERSRSERTRARRVSETLRQETLTRLGIQAVEPRSGPDPVPFCMRRIGRRGAVGRPGHKTAEPEGRW